MVLREAVVHLWDSPCTLPPARDFPSHPTPLRPFYPSPCLVHIIGSLLGAKDFPASALYCHFAINTRGPHWTLLSGSLEGETHIVEGVGLQCWALSLWLVHCLRRALCVLTGSWSVACVHAHVCV